MEVELIWVYLFIYYDYVSQVSEYQMLGNFMVLTSDRW